MTKIKICGIRSFEDAKLALDLGADALGFNFYSGSKRYISPGDAQAIVRQLPPKAWFVGVFVNAGRSEIEHIARQVGLDTLQFHGDEDEKFIQGWKEWRTIRAVRVGEKIDLEQVKRIAALVDHVMFDVAKDGAFGGTGAEVEDTALEKLTTHSLLTNAFLAGGLTPKNVSNKITTFRPWGVDVASGVELSPGQKSAVLMKDFIEAVLGAAEH